MRDPIQKTKTWYEESYLHRGLNSQRRYPNEELLRFMGRNYFGIPREDRKDIRILELGCGSCANLWMVAREGFSAYGLDLSTEAIRLGEIMLKNWMVEASLQVGSMKQLPYENGHFDVVLDVFSAYCLDEADFEQCLGEVARVLKPGGCFFSYTPGKGSDAFQHCRPSRMIDASTLDGMKRSNSPFPNNDYPFRFVHPEEYRQVITSADMKVRYLETVRRSYFDRKEIFEHVVLEAEKQQGELF